MEVPGPKCNGRSGTLTEQTGEMLYKTDRDMANRRMWPEEPHQIFEILRFSPIDTLQE
jgi:hypothetical protein